MEAVLPQVVADDRDERRTGALIGVIECAAEQRWHAERAERRRRHFGSEHRFGDARAARQVARDRAIGREVVDAAQRLAPADKVVRGALLRAVRRGIPVLEDHEPIARGQRDRRRHELPQGFEGARANPDREGHRDAADRGQHRVLHEHAAAELEVEPRDAQAVEPAQATRVPRLLQVVGRVAELGARLPPRRRFRQAAAHEVFRAQFDVQAELFLEVGVHVLRAGDAAPDGAQPGDQFGDHGSGLARRGRQRQANRVGEALPACGFLVE